MGDCLNDECDDDSDDCLNDYSDDCFDDCLKDRFDESFGGGLIRFRGSGSSREVVENLREIKR